MLSFYYNRNDNFNLSSVSLNRVAIGNVSWGVQLVSIRRNAPSDVSVSASMYTMPGSDVINGRGLWRIGLFGSPSANGSSGDRFNYVRQLLSPSESSQNAGPSTKLTFPSLITQFDVLSLGCTEFKYLCIEIAKGDNPQPDFVFHNDAQKPIILCRKVSCQGQGKPIMKILITGTVKCYYTRFLHGSFSSYID